MTLGRSTSGLFSASFCEFWTIFLGDGEEVAFGGDLAGDLGGTTVGLDLLWAGERVWLGDTAADAFDAAGEGLAGD